MMEREREFQLSPADISETKPLIADQNEREMSIVGKVFRSGSERELENRHHQEILLRVPNQTNHGNE